MPEPKTIVIAGAGAGAVSVAENLRSNGFSGTLRIVGSEQHFPYERPPLSKQVLAGTWEIDRAMMLPDRRLAAIDADWLLGQPAVSLDTTARRIQLASGERIDFAELVVATGVIPRTFTPDRWSNVYCLRTLDDAVRLRAVMSPGRRLVVVGGGFLGMEAAATAAMLGMLVSVVEPVPGPPLASRIGPLAATALAELHQQNGVEVVTGVGVSALAPDDALGSHYASPDGPAVQKVQLSDGRSLPADLVLGCVGSLPSTRWLHGSGLKLDYGVVCDSHCRAAPGVWAAGDVARWHHPALGRLVRFEHRMNATQQGQAVARNILGAATPFSPVPFSWTDQFGVKIQLHGIVTAASELVDGSPEEGSFVQVFRDDGGIVGVLGWNAARRIRAYREQLTSRFHGR